MCAQTISALNIGILGCARIARRGVIAGIQQSGVAHLAAIASRNFETAQVWSQEFGIPRAYDSYEALIDDPQIDAVYIPLPNELHRQWTLRAAERGKHVLCEKPLALDAAEAEQMAAGCRERGVVLMEAFMWRHQPAVAEARRMLSDGEIGELRLVKMDFSFQIDPGDWRLEAGRGGGALFDLGCYGINAARLFAAAEPVEIFALGRLHSSGVDITAGVELRFAGGAIALLDCSFECPYRNRIEIVGTRGAIELPDGVLPTPVGRMIVRGDSAPRALELPGDQYAEEVKAFAASVAAGRLLAPAEDGVANMRVLHAVRQQVLSTAS